MFFKGRILFYPLLKKLLKLLPLSPTAINNVKVKGGALYIAILVSIIIGIILCMFIMIANFNQRNVTKYAQASQLNFNLQSAFEMAQSDYFTEEKNNKWIKNTLNEDSLKIKKMYWGAYLLITAQTKNRHHSLSQSGLYGSVMPSDTGLMISDNSRPVGLSGAIVFKANCYLPKAGIKGVFIEGQSFINSPQNTGFTKISPMQIPLVDKGIIEEIKQQQNNSNVYLDSVVSFLPQNYDQSFNNKTIVFEVSGQLNNMHLKNNIKIIGKNIEISNTCTLENVLIVCDKVKFKEGFKGKVHVIAGDSIITEKKCEFNYPSSFVLLPKESETNTLNWIDINEDCKFYGGILALNKSDNQNSTKVFIKLNGKCEVNGFIYSSDYLHLQGKMNATIICDKLLLKTPSAVYENHMLACEIDPKKYSHLLAIPQIFKKTARLMCCQKMN
ncbi:MAG: hypothetical protein H0W73_08590 [Bacteroidetes bacterium]|nr:hypothetical protein [Bacteroidota bacterium]